MEDTKQLENAINFIQKGTITIEKLKSINNVIEKLSNNQQLTLSSSFCSKFKMELLNWAMTLQTQLEKELKEFNKYQA